MKNKAYFTILLSHITVIIVLFTPIIRVTEIKMNSVGQKIENSFFVNIVDFMGVGKSKLTAVLVLVLACVQLIGLINAVYGLIKKGYSHTSINLTFACAFSVALLGAVHLYSKSYAFFTVCATAFFIGSYCSVKLIKAEE